MVRRRHHDDSADVELLRAAHAGDDEAMEVLVGRHRPAIEAWVRRRSPDPALLDEVVGRVMLRLWQVRRYDERRGTMAAWVMVLTRTAFLDVLRQRRRDPVPTESVPSEASVVDETERIVTAAVLDDLQEHLSSNHREVVRWVFGERLTMTEAAALLELPVGTVKSRCFYALRVLRLRAEEIGLVDG